MTRPGPSVLTPHPRHGSSTRAHLPPHPPTPRWGVLAMESVTQSVYWKEPLDGKFLCLGPPGTRPWDWSLNLSLLRENWDHSSQAVVDSFK